MKKTEIEALELLADNGINLIYDKETASIMAKIAKEKGYIKTYSREEIEVEGTALAGAEDQPILIAELSEKGMAFMEGRKN